MRPDVHQMVEKHKNKLYMYSVNGTVIRILYATDSNQIVTDKGLISVPEGVKAAVWFAETFLEVDETEASRKESQASPVQQITNIHTPTVEAQKLTDVILNNIEKIQNDPQYIPQAEAINNSINTLMNVARTQLQIMKGIKNG